MQHDTATRCKHCSTVGLLAIQLCNGFTNRSDKNSNSLTSKPLPTTLDHYSMQGATFPPSKRYIIYEKPLMGQFIFMNDVTHIRTFPPPPSPCHTNMLVIFSVVKVFTPYLCVIIN